MISVCMIVKNEEKIIEKSLKAISKYNFEIVVIDTGSTDKTKNIALKYTDKVFDYKWKDDFSSARNFSIDKATSKYILVIDADEIIESIDINSLKEAIDGSDCKVGRILRINEYSRDDQSFKYKERVNRLFNKDYYKYAGRIHEQIVRYDNKSYDTYNINIIVNHSGYENDEIKRKDKISRNITLLKQELQERGDDPYILYQLGKSYYMKDEYDKSIDYFIKAMDFDLDTKLEYVQDMIESYGYALINTKRYIEALDIINLYNEFNSSCDFVFLCGLIYMNNGLFEKAINEFSKSLTFNNSKMEGSNSYLANYNIGVIYECLGDKDKAYRFYKKCRGYKLADKAINRIKF